MIIFIAVYEYSFPLFFFCGKMKRFLPKEIHFHKFAETLRLAKHHAKDVYGHKGESERRKLQNSCHKIVNTSRRALDLPWDRDGWAAWFHFLSQGLVNNILIHITLDSPHKEKVHPALPSEPSPSDSRNDIFINSRSIKFTIIFLFHWADKSLLTRSGGESEMWHY